MEATLTIKNETGADLEIETGGVPKKLAPGATADLSAKELQSRGFAQVLDAGKVSFVKVQKPGQDEIDLARKVLPAMVVSTRERMAKFKSSFEQSQKELLQLRESFNKAWKVAEASLGAAQSALAGWPALNKAVRNLLLDTMTEDPEVTAKKDAVKALEERIAALKKEEPATTGRTLEQWYADRVVREQELKEAQDALAKVSDAKADRLAADVDALDANVTALTALTKDKAIGKPLAEFGK